MKAGIFLVVLAVLAGALAGVARAGDPTAEQAAALQRLQAASTTPVSADFADGAPRFVRKDVHRLPPLHRRYHLRRPSAVGSSRPGRAHGGPVALRTRCGDLAYRRRGGLCVRGGPRPRLLVRVGRRTGPVGSNPDNSRIVALAVLAHVTDGWRGYGFSVLLSAAGVLLYARRIREKRTWRVEPPAITYCAIIWLALVLMYGPWSLLLIAASRRSSRFPSSSGPVTLQQRRESQGQARASTSPMISQAAGATVLHDPNVEPSQR